MLGVSRACIIMHIGASGAASEQGRCCAAGHAKALLLHCCGGIADRKTAYISDSKRSMAFRPVHRSDWT